MNAKKKRQHEEEEPSTSQNVHKKKHKCTKEVKGKKEGHQMRSPFKVPYLGYMPFEQQPEAPPALPYGYRYYQVSPKKDKKMRYGYTPEGLPYPGIYPKKTKRFFLQPHQPQAYYQGMENNPYEGSSSESDSESSSSEDSDETTESSSGDDSDTPSTQAQDNKSTQGSVNETSEAESSVANPTEEKAGGKKSKKKGKDQKKRKRKAKWKDDQKIQLVQSYRARIALVRGKFKGGSGGKLKRKNAWKEIAGEVSEQNGPTRSVNQCKKKIGSLHGEVRKKNRDLKSRYSKSGAGQIPLEEQLDKTEIMILTYLGEEAATGIPNVARAPVKPGDEKFLLTPETKINRTATKNPNHLDDISSLMQEENPHTEPNKDDGHEVSSSTHSDVEDLNEPGVQRVEDDFDDVNFPAFDPSLGQSTVEVIGGPKKDTKGVKNAGVVVPKTVGPASNNDSEPEDVKPNLAELQMQVKRNLEQQIHREISEVADTSGVIKVRDVTGLRQSLETCSDGTAQGYEYHEDYKGVAKEVEIDTSGHTEHLPLDSLPDHTLPDIHEQLGSIKYITAAPNVAANSGFTEPMGPKYGIKTEISEESVPEEMLSNVDDNHNLYNDLMNVGMPANGLLQATLPNQGYVDSVAPSVSSIHKGDPSLKEILNRQVDLAEKQENLLKSCTEAMESQKQMFERMGNILKAVSLTQEKTSTMSLSIAKAFVDMERKQHEEKIKVETENKVDPCWCCGAPQITGKEKLKAFYEGVNYRDPSMPPKQNLVCNPTIPSTGDSFARNVQLEGSIAIGTTLENAAVKTETFQDLSEALVMKNETAIQPQIKTESVHHAATSAVSLSSIGTAGSKLTITHVTGSDNTLANNNLKGQYKPATGKCDVNSVDPSSHSVSTGAGVASKKVAQEKTESLNKVGIVGHSSKGIGQLPSAVGSPTVSSKHKKDLPTTQLGTSVESVGEKKKTPETDSKNLPNLEKEVHKVAQTKNAGQAKEDSNMANRESPNNKLPEMTGLGEKKNPEIPGNVNPSETKGESLTEGDDEDIASGKQKRKGNARECKNKKRQNQDQKNHNTRSKKKT